MSSDSEVKQLSRRWLNNEQKMATKLHNQQDLHIPLTDL